MFDFSIVVPTFNRLDALGALLGGIARLDYPPEHFQVVVVNDGGAPVSPEMKRSFGGQLDVCWLDQTNRGPAAARNYGAQHARGIWLAFIDDDCIPEPGWLGALAEVLGPNLLVGGAVLNGCPNNVYAAASQCLFDFLYSYYHGAHGAGSQSPFFTGNNLACERALFAHSGGFDASMRHGEDREFCARLGAQGVVLRYAARAEVRHYRPMHARAFWQQHWEYGTGAFAYHQRARTFQRDTVLPEPMQFYTGMLSWPWRNARAARAAQLMSLVVMAQTANVCGFGYAAIRSRRGGTRSAGAAMR